MLREQGAHGVTLLRDPTWDAPETPQPLQALWDTSPKKVFLYSMACPLTVSQQIPALGSVVLGTADTRSPVRGSGLA